MNTLYPQLGLGTQADMLTVIYANGCACDGNPCDWYTHAQRGAGCEKTFSEPKPPRGWQTTSDGRAVCPACVVIAALRELGP